MNFSFLVCQILDETRKRLPLNLILVNVFTFPIYSKKQWVNSIHHSFWKKWIIQFTIFFFQFIKTHELGSRIKTDENRNQTQIYSNNKALVLHKKLIIHWQYVHEHTSDLCPFNQKKKIKMSDPEAKMSMKIVHLKKWESFHAIIGFFL